MYNIERECFLEEDIKKTTTVTTSSMSPATGAGSIARRGGSLRWPNISARENSSKTTVTDQITQAVLSTSNLLHIMLQSSPSQVHFILKELVRKSIAETVDRYQYETEDERMKARDVWEIVSKNRCRGTWINVRKKCKKETGSNNPADWRGCRPDFVYEEDWLEILDSWMTDRWVKLSAAGNENRKSVPGAEPGSCSYVRHTGGSINFSIHLSRMEAELGRKPDQIEFFVRLHKKQKGKGEWCDIRARKTAEKYQLMMTEKSQQSEEVENDMSASRRLFDPESWSKAIGGPKKNRVYGFGLSHDAEKILGSELCPSSNKGKKSIQMISTPTDEEIEANIQSKVDAIVNARLEEVESQMEKKMEEKMQQRLREIVAGLRIPTADNGFFPPNSFADLLDD